MSCCAVLHAMVSFLEPPLLRVGPTPRDAASPTAAPTRSPSRARPHDASSPLACNRSERRSTVWKQEAKLHAWDAEEERVHLGHTLATLNNLRLSDLNATHFLVPAARARAWRQIQIFLHSRSGRHVLQVPADSHSSAGEQRLDLLDPRPALRSRSALVWWPELV